MSNPRDEEYYEEFFTALSELVGSLDKKEHKAAINLFNLAIDAYEILAESITKVPKKKKEILHHISELHDESAKNIRKFKLSVEFRKYIESSPKAKFIVEPAIDSEMSFDEDWQQKKVSADLPKIDGGTIMKEMTNEEIIERAKVLIQQGGNNEKEKKDIEMLEGYLKYNDINGMKTIIDSLPQGHAIANKSEGWFNTLKNAGAVTTTSAGQSALQNVAYGKPKNKHEQMEEEEFPIVVEDEDFWRD